MPPQNQNKSSIALRREKRFQTYLENSTSRVNKAIDRYVPKARAYPETIHTAMRYSLFAGGKRLRPALLFAAAQACGGNPLRATPAAVAVEMIHTYSLIHDDLPCMDNDDFRRGKPTSHKVYGEGIAVLAGDALLTEAFAVLSGAKPTARYTTAQMIHELALASGSQHLIAGQVLDLEHENRPISRKTLKFIHEAKTAALLTAALRLGAMSANATSAQLKSLTRFGHALGLCFQIIDDILDVTQSSEKLGKSAGKDIAAGKATYPALFGLEASRKEADRLTAEAHDALGIFGIKAKWLREIADHLLTREF